MFFNDLDLGVSLKGFDPEASACLWHDLAFNYMLKRIKNGETWGNRNSRHLETMLRYRSYLKSAKNIKDIIVEILTCNKGVCFKIQHTNPLLNEIEINSETNEKPIKIPLLDTEYRNAEEINKFMRDNGLRQYALVDLEELIPFLENYHPRLNNE